MEDGKKFGISFYEALKRAVSMSGIANYFFYNKEEDGSILVSFGSKEKYKIFLDSKNKVYRYKKNGKIIGNFVNLFIQASKECFDDEYTILEAQAQIKKLLLKGKLRTASRQYLDLLRHGLYNNKLTSKVSSRNN